MIPSATPNPPLLLLVDDQPANLRLLAEILRDDYGITTTTRGAEVLDLAGREPQPDLILLDVMMPDVHGLEVLHRLHAHPSTSEIPVILISADGTELTQYTGLEKGADDYVVKPIQPRILLARVRNLLRRKRAEDALRESEARFRSYFELPLAGRAITSPSTGWIDVNATLCQMLGYAKAELVQTTWAELTHPDDLAADWAQFRRVMAGEIDGYTLEKRFIHKDGRIVVTELAVQCLRCSDQSVDYLVALIQDITQRKHLEKILQQQATTDELTGLFNRRYFLELAPRELKRATRRHDSISVALLDVDHFKQINDTYGHQAGDQALIAFAKTCQQHIREMDMLARFGGDEFVLLLPEADSEQACEVVERIRLALALAPVDHRGQPIPMTLSAGIACWADEPEPLDDLLGRADQGLYQAKNQGRNGIIVAQ